MIISMATFCKKLMEKKKNKKKTEFFFFSFEIIIFSINNLL